MICLGEYSVELTFTWAEAIFLVLVVVSCGGTPWQIVCAALCGAGGVRFAPKTEGKVARGAIRISKASLHNYIDRRDRTFNYI